jgi:hypothetical protein
LLEDGCAELLILLLQQMNQTPDPPATLKMVDTKAISPLEMNTKAI